MITFLRFLLLISMMAFSCAFATTFVQIVRVALFYDGRLFDFDMLNHPLLLLDTLYWCAGVFVPLVIIMGSPVGDIIAGMFFATRRGSMREKQKIMPAVIHLQKLYFERYGTNIKIKLYVLDMPFINGFALGRYSIAVSTGLLKTASEDEVTAILAHEMGHLHHRDGFFSLALLTARLPTLFFRGIFKFILYIFFRPNPNKSASGSGGEYLVRFAMGAFILAALLPFTVLGLISFPVLWFYQMLEKAARWPIEYRADQFCADMGFSEPMIKLFARMEGQDIRGGSGFLIQYIHSHPPMALRIDRLEQQQCV